MGGSIDVGTGCATRTARTVLWPSSPTPSTFSATPPAPTSRCGPRARTCTQPTQSCPFFVLSPSNTRFPDILHVQRLSVIAVISCSGAEVPYNKSTPQTYLLLLGTGCAAAAGSRPGDAAGQQGCRQAAEDHRGSGRAEKGLAQLPAASGRRPL